MEQKINLILSNIQSFCRKGYLKPKEREVLNDLADIHEIDRKVLDDYVAQALEKSKKAKKESFYRVSNQPDAALSDVPSFYPQSRRQFPDVVKIGSLSLKMNPKVTAPFFLPIMDTDNLCVKYAESSEEACNIMQNVAVRILLSLPRSLTRITILDPENMGNQLLSLSSIDRSILNVVGETNSVTTFLQNLSREINAFNFNELGNKFASIADYNRTNRSKAKQYNIILIPDYPRVIQKEQTMALAQIMKLAHKTGVFLITTASAADLRDNADLEKVLKNNQCFIDISSSKSVVNSVEQMQIINNGFDIVLKKEIEFTDETLYELNHELKPDAYPPVPVVPEGDDCIEALTLSLGEYKPIGKENVIKEFIIQLQGENDNLLIVSADDKQINDMTNRAIENAVMNYKPGEVKFAFCNYETVPIEARGNDLLANFRSQKPAYLKGLLGQISSIVEERKQKFEENDYVNYRKNSDETIPCIVVVISSFDSFLSSTDLEAVEVIMQLDQLLATAGRYGIHFILTGHPSNDFFKINLAGCMHYKLLGKITQLEARMLGLFLNEEDSKALEDTALAIPIIPEEDQIIKLDVKPLDPDQTKIMMERINQIPDDAKFDAPAFFFDQDDNYPSCYEKVNASHVSEKALEGSFPIGFLRTYTNSFCSLKTDDIFTMVLGDDQEAVLSIMKSFHTALLRRGLGDGLSVYDAHGSSAIGIAGLPNVPTYDNLDRTPVKEHGVVCLLNMESYDYSNLQSLASLIKRAHELKTKVVFFSKDDVIAEGKINTSLFEAKEKIALMHAPGDFISLIHFASHSLLSLPQIAYGAIIEQETDNYATQANAVWLFKY